MPVTPTQRSGVPMERGDVPVTPMERLWERWRVLVHEMAKFGVVGVINTALSIGLLNLLQFKLRLLGPLSALLVATVVAATASYFMNRHWSFRHRARSGLRREYILFFVLNGIGLLISEAVMATVAYGLGYRGVFAVNMANLVGTGLGMIFRFWAYKRWVFVAAADPEPLDLASELAIAAEDLEAAEPSEGR